MEVDGAWGCLPSAGFQYREGGRGREERCFLWKFPVKEAGNGGWCASTGQGYSTQNKLPESKNTGGPSQGSGSPPFLAGGGGCSVRDPVSPSGLVLALGLEGGSEHRGCAGFER